MHESCEIIKELQPWWQKRVTLASHKDFWLVVIKKWPIESFIWLERIRREVELLSTLDSEFYPKQYHFNIDIKTKEFIIVEEYIEWATLREKMATINSVSDIFWLLNKIVQGLDIIWARGVVHRDLKPENIIIRPDWMPCIIDLGIALFAGMERLTQSINPFWPCTPPYASPEQLMNKKHLIDQRSDFFALWIICLELYLWIHVTIAAIRFTSSSIEISR